MLSRRHSSGLTQKEENYEHVLMCLICRSLFDDYDHQPKFLPCHHTFCKDCLREYVKQAGDEIECPSCRKNATIPTAGVVALQTNFYVKYIQSLVYGPSVASGNALECDIHPHAKLLYYCKECYRSVCNKCCDEEQSLQCKDHKRILLTQITEEYHQKLDSAFSKANCIIEHKKVELEAMMKALSEEKDQAMKKIDSTFEQHIHTLTRRTTLLKNKVIAIYNEHVEKLECDLEEISTAMTCIVSLKEYHEDMIGKGHFIDIQKGISEMEEVFCNIKGRIQPKENHIVFEEKHGVEKYKTSAKDLGRVQSSRPILPRAEPDGNDADGAQSNTGPFSPATPGGIPSDPECNSPSDGIDIALGFSDSQGATGGATGTEMCLGAGCEPKDLTESQTNMTCNNGNHGNNPRGCASSKTSNHGNSTVSRCDTGSNSCTINGNSISQLNAHGHSLLDNKLDVNSNTPIAVPGVVRPKTLSGNHANATKGQGSTTSGTLKDNGLIKRSSHGNSDHKHSSKSNVYTLHRSDPGPGHQEALSLSNLRPPEPASLDPEIENLRQTDKMYHHLVYTSYDEEELLKELKCGKVHFDSGRGPALPLMPATTASHSHSFPPPARAMEDSDGWMTVSSESTISVTSEEVTLNDEQSRL